MVKKENSRKTREEAITLVVLVITIIVLLILAGITIGALTGNNGILTKAIDTKENTKIGEEIEKIELSVIGALAKDNGGTITEKYLEEELNSYIGERNIDYQLNGTGPFVVKYLDSQRSYFIDKNGKVNEYTDVSAYLKIGDYVNYKPDNIDQEYNKFGETYSGYANENIGQDDNLEWRILNINSDGTLDLISDKPTSTEIYFQGARGYNNGVYLLNDYCKTMYSNNSLGAEARSLNIEDIEKKMKIIDEEAQKKIYENYVSAIGTVYETTYIYSTNKWYPLQWINDNGAIGESKQTTLTEYKTENDAVTQESNVLTITQTYWYLEANEMKLNFISANTRDTSKSSNMYYELLCNNGISSYWLASRFVNSNDINFASFGLRNIREGFSRRYYSYQV